MPVSKGGIDYEKAVLLIYHNLYGPVVVDFQRSFCRRKYE